MRMKKLTYLFAICPAIVALASCNNGGNGLRVPGKVATYEEAYKYVKENFPYDKGFMRKLSKSADVVLSTDGIDVDGTLTIPEWMDVKTPIEPTHISTSLPAQKNITFNLNNTNATQGAMYTSTLLHMLEKDKFVSGLNINTQSSTIASLLPMTIFNPFINVSSLEVVDNLVRTVNNLNIIEQAYTIDDDGTFYISIGIGDLGKLTEFIDNLPKSNMLPAYGIFNLIRGKDGSVYVDLGFDADGFLKSANISLNSNLMSINMQDPTGSSERNLFAIYYGKLNLSFKAQLTHTFYADDESYDVKFIDSSLTPSFAFARPTYQNLLDVHDTLNYLYYEEVLEESPQYYFNPSAHRDYLSGLYENSGMMSGEVGKYAYDLVSGYYKYLMPGFGTDFVITSSTAYDYYNYNYDVLKVKINGFEYPLSTFNAGYDSEHVDVFPARSAESSAMIEMVPFLDSKTSRYNLYVAIYPEFYEAVGSDIEIVFRAPEW